MTTTFREHAEPWAVQVVDLESLHKQVTDAIVSEIQAETKGTVVEVLVENGQPVEYGQRLFKVKQG